MQYHKDNESIYNIIKKMQKEGASIKQIAIEANKLRNLNRLQSYLNRGNLEGYNKAVESNIKNFGNEFVMTPEQAYEKYGSWEVILEKQ